MRALGRRGLTQQVALLSLVPMVMLGLALAQVLQGLQKELLRLSEAANAGKLTERGQRVQVGGLRLGGIPAIPKQDARGGGQGCPTCRPPSPAW